MSRRAWRLVALAGALSLSAAACVRSETRTGAERSPAASGEAEEMMPLQADAASWKVKILSPADGQKVTSNEVPVKVEATGYDLTCDLAGKPNQAGKGHYHVTIDKSLVNMYCDPEARISMQNLKPGSHRIAVHPAQDDHNEVLQNEVEVTIDYQPASPLKEITDETGAGKPSIEILEPKPGTTLSGPFTVKIRVSNFELSCALYGKPAVAGYGHWHLNYDASTGPMMGMGTMAGMSCEQTFEHTTDGFKSGSTHTLIALLVDNGHAPLSPAVEDKVDVKIA
jgi:hypothetical protein